MSSLKLFSHVCRGTQPSAALLMRGAMLTLFVAIGTPAVASPVESGQRLTAVSEAKILPEVRNEIQSAVNAQKRIEGQENNIRITASFSALDGGRWLLVDLSDGYIPKRARYFDSEMEAAISQLRTVIDEILRDKNGDLPVDGVRFLFGGKTIEEAFPEEKRQMLQQKTTVAPAAADSLVVVAAGHGVYYHYGYKDWRPQRDPYNGITEDYITQGYATALADLIRGRSLVPVEYVRSRGTEIHAPSGFQWQQMASRYFLQQILPSQTGIWHSLPSDTSNLREQNEDIRSRPLYANYLSASKLIHIHTNGPSATATGPRVLYYPGRTVDQQLATSILCGMKETIHALPAYANFTVPAAPTPSDGEGETRLAAMPSVIVEVAFHSNPTDAAALKDPAFRTAAMKGVEKGYRIHTQGKACTPFAITSIPSITIKRGDPSVAVKANFAGFPQFPVVRKTTNVSCPSGHSCSNGSQTYRDEVPSPLTWTASCSGTSSTTDVSRWSTTLTDADGVKTAPVEYTITCLPNALTKTAGNTALSNPAVGDEHAN